MQRQPRPRPRRVTFVSAGVRSRVPVAANRFVLQPQYQPRHSAAQPTTARPTREEPIPVAVRSQPERNAAQPATARPTQPEPLPVAVRSQPEHNAAQPATARPAQPDPEPIPAVPIQGPIAPETSAALSLPSQANSDWAAPGPSHTDPLISDEFARHMLLQCSCGHILAKDGGCNYVQCRCGLEWCWVCGRVKYGSGCTEASHNSH